MSADLVIAGYVHIAKQDLDGARLLNRDRRRVTLTPPGETLRDSVDAIFQQVEHALRITRDAVGYQSFKI